MNLDPDPLYTAPDPDPEPDTFHWCRTDTAYLVSVVLLVAVSLAIGYMRWKA